eukprot:s4533_g5.t1
MCGLWLVELTCEPTESMAPQGNEQADPANSDPGPCVLLVTKCGLGARVPLSSKRIGLGRRGGVPKRVLRVADHDSVAAACVVSGKDIREPEKPMEALQLYLKDHGDSTEAIFNSLPQEDMMPYQKQQDEEKRKYEEALKAFRQEDCEEVLLGNTGGAVTRIKVSTVPIVTRLNRGRLLAKTKGSDRICVASLLSSIEDDQDETGKEPAKSTPSNSAASRSRRAAERAADSAGSSLRGEAAPSEAPAQKPEVPVLPVPLPVERTPRSKLTQSLAKRRSMSAHSLTGPSDGWPFRKQCDRTFGQALFQHVLAEAREHASHSKLDTAAEAQTASAEDPLLREESAPQSLHV